VREAARDTYEDVRQGILALRAGGTLEEGLLPTLERFLEQYRAQTGLTVALKVPDQRVASLSQAAQVQLLRIIQEALANIRKHARAQQVEIDFRPGAGSRVIVRLPLPAEEGTWSP
jgi:signal transduction histidine kinase